MPKYPTSPTRIAPVTSRPSRVVSSRPWPIDRVVNCLLDSTESFRLEGLRPFKNIEADALIASLYVSIAEHSPSCRVYALRIVLSTYHPHNPHFIAMYGPDTEIMRFVIDDAHPPTAGCPAWMCYATRMTSKRPYRFTCSREWMQHWLHSLGDLNQADFNSICSLGALLFWLEDIPTTRIMLRYGCDCNQPLSPASPHIPTTSSPAPAPVPSTPIPDAPLATTLVNPKGP
ncbi:hypothetical protein CERSUDRAFT_97732 [Gelatoporia subvermispora B]|uniref:Uncharacterized protein n=1 Tax=Ceriporiopsis subvermispora (strain B) TaxID=914234 RepID=M2R7U1_CERS8|nr:hypothetical protein CERSUDRAFT_97732 [Gelatoporia subvermispora B]